MPIYEYCCGSCGKQFEAMQKFSDAPLASCTLCGKGPVEKMVSRTSFQLKGGGWYATDYKKSPASSSTPGPKEGSGSAESSGSTEKKPAGTKTSGSDK